MNKRSVALLSSALLALCALMASPTFGQTSTPQATPPYVLSVFAQAPSGLSAPDSVAILGDHVFIGYGDNHAPDGSDGLNSQVVDYLMDGTISHIYTVTGHNDGIKIDPTTHLVWALQNEDANPNLVIINPETHQQKEYTFGPTPHGGGYDDMVFRGCDVYISASNPANNPNTGPAIVSAHIEGNVVQVESVLSGEANAIDLPTDDSIQLNLQDPDSMTLDPLGNIVLDSQADQELIIVSDVGPDQRVLRLPLSYQTPNGPVSVETDDTAFITSTEGFLLFADKNLNAVYKLSKIAFAPGTAYTAADGGPFVGRLDLTTGVVTPVVTGLVGPGGMMFVDTSAHAQGWGQQDDHSTCHDRDGNF